MGELENAVDNRDWNKVKSLLESGDSEVQDVCADLCVNLINNYYIHNLIAENDIFVLVEFLNLMQMINDKNEIHESVAKLYEEIKIQNIELSEEVDVTIQQFLLDIRFYSEKKDKNDDLSIFQATRERIATTINFIQELHVARDDLLIFILRNLIENLRVLKLLLMHTYEILPWEEIEFCLIIFLRILMKLNETDIAYKRVLDKTSFPSYLNTFGNLLGQLGDNLTPNDIKRKCKLTDRSKYVNAIKLNNTEFVNLYKDFETTKDFHSLSKIKTYIELALKENVDPNSAMGKLIIQRALQVTGEYLKNTPTSPNVSDNAINLLISTSPQHVKKLLSALRDDLSKAKSITRKIFLEKHESKYFHTIKEDLRKIHVGISYVIYNLRSECLKLFYNKLDESDHSEGFLKLFTIVDFRTEFLGANEQIEYTEKFEQLLQKLRKLNENKNDQAMKGIEELEGTLQRCKLMENDRSLLYQSQINGAKRYFQVADSDLEFGMKDIVSNLSEHFKLLTYAKKGFMDEMLFSTRNIVDFIGEESVQCMVEILNLILGIDTITGIEDFKADITRSEIDVFPESSVNDIFLYIEKGFKKMENAEKFRNAVISKQRKYLLKQKLKDYYNENCEDKERISSIIKEFQDLPECKNVLETFQKKGSEDRKNYISKIDDPYGLLLKQLSELNALSVEKYTKAIITFTKSLKLKNSAKVDLETSLEVFSSKDAKQYFCDRLEILRSLIQRKNVSEVIMDPTILSAIEMLLLDLSEILANFGCFKDATFIFDQHSPILMGKSLRNYLAHGDALYDILPTDPKIGIVLNALKFIEEGEILLNVRTKSIGSKYFFCPNRLMENRISYRGIREWLDLCKFEFSEMKVKHKLQPKIRNCRQFTGLHAAAAYNNVKAFEYLFNFNDLRNKSVDGFESAALTMFANSNDVIKYILDHKLIDGNATCAMVFPCQPLWHGKTIAHVAIITGGNFELWIDDNVDVVDFEGYTLLHEAVKRGNLAAVKKLVEKGADLEKSSNEGETPLFLAAENGFCDIISFLLDQNVDIDIRTSNGRTPLHGALLNRKYDAAKLLVSRRADVNAEDKYKITPLKCVIGIGQDREMIKFLLNNKADVHLAHCLHFAVFVDCCDSFELLFKSGAYINDVESKNGNSVLHEAALSSCPVFMEILLQKHLELDARNKEGFTALHMAALKGHTKQAEMLLTHKASINARINENGATPLHLSASNDHLETFQLLLDHRADVNEIDTNGSTPLLYAAEGGAVKVVEKLMRMSQVNKTASFEGNTALHLAAVKGHEMVVKLLLKNTDWLEVITNKLGETPLHLAAQMNHFQVLQLLLDAGFDVNRRSKNGHTSLHYAALNDSFECVKLLIERKADLDIMDNIGYTPICYAAWHGRKDVVTLLMESGTNLSIRSGNLSPQMLAARAGHTNILKLLPYDPVAICCAANDSCFNSLFQQREQQLCELKATPGFLIINSVKANNLFVLKKIIDLGFDVNSVQDDDSPLYYVIENDKNEAMKVLLDNGADVNLRCRGNITPLHLAVTVNSEEKVDTLLKKGADCHAKAKLDLTPLHCAIRRASKKIIEKLIKAGSDIEAKDADGVTPLQIAVRFRNEDVVDLLLHYGCKVTSMNNHSSVLHVAVSVGNVDIVRKIIRGFNVDDFYENLDVQDSRGDTPLMWAIETKNIELVVELLRFGAKPWIKNAMGMDCFDWARQVEDVKILSVLFIYCEKLV